MTSVDTAGPAEGLGGRPPCRLASPGRRTLGLLLELLLCAGTLGVGWLAWSVAEWRRGRTPAKRLLGMRVVEAGTDETAGWRHMALRQVVHGFGVVGLFGLCTLGLGWVLAALFVLSPTRQSMTDRLALTAVVAVRGGAR